MGPRRGLLASPGSPLQPYPLSRAWLQQATHQVLPACRGEQLSHRDCHTGYRGGFCFPLASASQSSHLPATQGPAAVAWRLARLSQDM